MEPVKHYDIIKSHHLKEYEANDRVVVEYPLTIILNDREFVTLLCTPKTLKGLVIGYLQSEGIIRSIEDIRSLIIEEEEGKAYVRLINEDMFSFIGDNLFAKKTITTACGNSRTVLYNVMDCLSKVEGQVDIETASILELSNAFSKKSKLFKETGGVHSCALCTQNEILLFEEDIGRHNALDKILGKALIEDINLGDKIVLTTGRVSSEIITKIAKRNIPVLVSRSAPTSIAIDMAKELRIALIGFARGQRMNIYSYNNN